MFAKAAILFAALAAVQALAPLGYGAPLLAAAPYGGVSVQKTAINHVAPAAPLAYAAPFAYGHGAGYLSYGLGAPFAYGHGLAAGPLGYGHGLLGARYAGFHGLGVAKAVL